MCLVISNTYGCMHQQSTSAIARKHEKTYNLDNEQSLLFLNSPLTRGERKWTVPQYHERSSFNWIPFNEKDEKPHMVRLENTAIPHIKIKITKIPLEKKLNTAILMCPSIQIDLYIFYYIWPSTILWLGKWLNCRHKSSNSQVVRDKFFHFLFSFHYMKPIDSMLSQHLFIVDRRRQKNW